MNPVVEVLHGISVQDDYRDLEDQQSPVTRDWLETQSDICRKYFNTISGLNRLKTKVRDLLAPTAISEPWRVGGRYFYLKRQEKAQQPNIVSRRPGEITESPLVTTSLGGTSDAALSILNVSHDGRILAYGVRNTGSYAQRVEFVDVRSARTMPDFISCGYGTDLVFSQGSNGFYYCQSPVANEQPRQTVRWHRFGSSRSEEADIFVAGENPELRLDLFGSARGEHLVFVVTNSGSKLVRDVYWHAPTNQAGTRKILEDVSFTFRPFFAGHTLLATTDFNAPNERIVSIDPERPDAANWTEVVPELPGRMRDIAVAGQFVCVGSIRDCRHRFDVFDLQGHLHCSETFPTGASLRLFRRTSEFPSFFYSLSSIGHPPIIFEYDVEARTANLWDHASRAKSTDNIQVDRVSYVSLDGTEVEMWLASKETGNKARPTFLTGYGGFGVGVTPQFNAYSSVLIEQGFLIALPMVRGGGERGEVWHLAGKRHNRQKAIDDFIAAAEWLVTNGRTLPSKLACGGGSNGSLLVAAAMVQRPELFRAVVCVGPLLDMLRYHRFGALGCVDEFGTADDPDDFQKLLGYSPYHNVQSGTAYPAVLFISGDADSCCNPMHARKMTARLQAATGSTNPILLEYTPTWGHAPTQPLDQRILSLSRRLAFICHELEVG